MIQELTLTYREIREICTISREVKSYFEETYPEVFKFYCDYCKKDTPCSGENWGIECEHEIKFKV